MKEFVIKWNNDWTKDWWWRNKHKVAFNSEPHRSISQFDIYFEFLEDKVLKKEMDSFDETKKKAERLKKDGWISESKVSKEKSKKAFDNIDLSKL